LEPLNWKKKRRVEDTALKQRVCDIFVPVLTAIYCLPEKLGHGISMMCCFVSANRQTRIFRINWQAKQQYCFIAIRQRRKDHDYTRPKYSFNPQ